MKNMPRSWDIWIATLCRCLIATASAVAAPLTVESVVPAVGRVGETFRVVLAGGHLKEAQDLLFYGPGLACIGLEVLSDNEIRATLRSSADSRSGMHPFRVRTPGGLSELKVVSLTRYPVIQESEPNDVPKTAPTVPMDTTVAGVIDSGDVDCVAVAMRKGMRFSAEVQAVRLGGEMTDTLMTILGPDGRVLATADDPPMTGQDPFATLVAPADGLYTIQIRETSYGGGPTATYALHIGDFPRPSGVFPPGGQAGKTVPLKLRGVAGPDVETVSFPVDAGPWWEFFPTIDGRVAPTSSTLRVRPYPSVDEADLGESAPPSAGGSTALGWPVAFHGIIGGRGDSDEYAIRAKAGDAVQVEVFAARIGSPLDSILEVLDPDGDLLARDDDDATHDSRLVFRAAAEGVYRIGIRDKRREGGPGFVYRIEVEPPRPSLTVFLAGPMRKSPGEAGHRGAPG